VESKHLKLSRSARKALDKELKPTAEQRAKFTQIVAYPPGQFLSIEEQDLVWKYRFFLSQDRKALAKFLQCVHWDKEEEVKQALDLLQQWIIMDTEDALELLGPTYHHPKVRSYAVARLQQAPDEVRSK
jgi:phosphatidylinositol 3-kinase